MVDFLIALVLFFIVGPILGARVSAWWLITSVLAIPLALLAAGVSLGGVRAPRVKPAHREFMQFEEAVALARGRSFS
jgi:hypothetical protein